MNTVRKSCLLFVCLLLQNVNAEVIRQPPGLKAGDAYHLAFITSGTRDSSSTDIEDYNEFVQTAADAAPEVGEWGIKWFAVGSTEAVRAMDNTRTNPDVTDADAPMYLVDGSPLYTLTYASFWGRGSIFSGVRPWSITEFGTERPLSNDGNVEVMTGFDHDGRTTSFPLGSLNGTTGGYYQLMHPDWFYDGGIGGVIAPGELPMYAISELLIAVPEPSSMAILFWLVPFAVALRVRYVEKALKGSKALKRKR